MDRAEESSMSRPSLPPSTVAKIFQAMQGNYGSRFLNQWKTGQVISQGEHAGKDAGLVNAMAFWGEKLAGFRDKTECIVRALNTLPPDPPSLPQFVDLCRMAPANDRQAALPFKPDPKRAAEFAAKLKAIVAGEHRGGDPIFWATHPRSQHAMDFILSAAKAEPARFQPCIDKLLDDETIRPNGQLLYRYRGLDKWEPVCR